MEEQIRISFFKHQVNALDDEKLFKLFRKEGMAGYGVWWRLLEMLGGVKEHRLQRDYEDIAFKMYHPDLAELIKRVVEDYGLFKTNKDYFWNSSFMAQMEDLNARYQKRAAAGSKGGKRKAELKQSQSNATAMPEQCQPPKEKIREEEIREDNHTCYSPSSTAEAENKHDAVALSNEANADNNDATTESFNFSEEVNDREYLAITREFMLKYAAAPTQFTDRLIALMAPDQWKGSRGTDFSNQKHRAANLVRVELPDKYRNGRGGQCTKAEREMVDTWLRWMAIGKIYDRDVINCYRGMTITTREDGSKSVVLFVSKLDDVHRLENNYMPNMSYALLNTLGKGFSFEYKIPKEDEK